MGAADVASYDVTLLACACAFASVLLYFLPVSARPLLSLFITFCGHVMCWKLVIVHGDMPIVSKHIVCLLQSA